MPGPPANRYLPHGCFLGEPVVSSSVGGLRFAHWVASVPAKAVSEHTHPEAHFVLVLSGEYVTSAAGPTVADDAPLLVYNPPGTTHRDRFAGAGRFFTISVGAPALEDFQAHSHLPDRAVVLGGPALDAALQLARSIRRQDERPDWTAEEHAARLLAAVAGAFRTREPGAPPWLRRVRERLHDEPPTRLSLAALAQDAGVHPLHVTRAFRRHYGVTPGEFVRRRRLGRAAARLARTRDALAIIALDCGFCDQAHFSRAFRAAFGVTPRAYRRAPA